MNSTNYKNRFRSLLRGLTAALTLLTASHAHADLCFPTPVALPGLSGPPNWTAPGVVRTELNEPRWAAAPQMGFESDDTDSEGFYRIVVNDARTEISVSFQAPVDLGSPSNADAVYFGFTRDGLSATLATAVRLNIPTSGTDPVPVTTLRAYNYDVGAVPQWAAGVPGTPPDWLKNAVAWRNDATAAWGINFKVDLTAPSLGSVDVAASFKMMLAMHIRDEMDPANSLNPSTPNPNCGGVGCPYSVLANTLFIENPVNWSTATPLNAGCIGGITISGNQLGTTNESPPGTAVPNKINTSLGATNTFYARPTYPVAPYAGMIEGKFHVANWGTIAASNAPWVLIPNGGAVQNGIAPATDVGELSFSCPVNAGGQTCGLATPGEPHQCIYVELRPAAGQTAHFTRAAAYRNMRFEPLSDFSSSAEISVKGLNKVFGDDKPRHIYLYVHAKNMPPHQEKPVYLPTDAMAATRRFAEAPPRVVQPSRGQDIRAAAALTHRPTVDAVARRASLPSTGVSDLDLSADQALRAVWPTYEVRAYYDTQRAVEVDGTSTKHLKAMYPFTYHHSHEGPLFGFSHELKGLGNVVVKELRPGLYYLEIENESVVQVVSSVTAHETAKGGGGDDPCAACPKPVEHGRCSCAIPGYNNGGNLSLTRNLGLFALLAIFAGAQLRRRRRS